MDHLKEERIHRKEDMENTGKKLICYISRKASLLKKEMDSKLNSPAQNKNSSAQSKKGCGILENKGCRLKRKSLRRKPNMRNGNLGGKSRKPLQKVSPPTSADIQSSLLLLAMRGCSTGEKCSTAASDGQIRMVKKRRRRRRKKRRIVRDDATRLQTRARYLLIRMKLEQNLIDAYSGDGWKGQSREKIKPEKELQRAEKQISKCKVGIRDAIRQLDLLSSERNIDNPVTYDDGSASHQHVFCARCQSREAFAGDQERLCKFCECKTRILETVNAHLGTCFTVNNSWEEIFMDETTRSDVKSLPINPAEEWPSEDSEDEDYDPEQVEIIDSKTGIQGIESEDSSSSSDYFCPSDEARSYSNGGSYLINHKSKKRISFDNNIFGSNSVETSDCEISSYRRQRRDVDYKKLHDEMFGKDDSDNEQSEDEDWGPHKRRRRIEPENGIRITDCGDEGGCSSKLQKETSSCDRKPAFRIPADAVEKLRQAFAENELPPRIVRENLSKQLGIPAEKVSKWFRNARYTALKTRKDETSKRHHTNNIGNGSTVKNQSSDEFASLDDSYKLPLSAIFRVRQNLQTRWRKNQTLMPSIMRKQQRSAVNATPLPTDKTQKLKPIVLDISSHQANGRFSNAIYYKRQRSCLRRKPFLKEMLSTNAKKPSFSPEKVSDSEQLYLVEIERLCRLEDRIRDLKAKVLACQDSDHPSTETLRRQPDVIYVPVIEVKEKVSQSTC